MNVQHPAAGADAPGRIEFVVESMRDGGGRETWLVMRDDTGARVVVEAQTLRSIGVLERPAPPNRPAGFNPYFDPPVAA